MIETVLWGLGAVLLIEGLVYLLAPSIVEDLLEALRSLSLSTRRMIGGLAVVIGLILILLAR